MRSIADFQTRYIDVFRKLLKYSRLQGGEVIVRVGFKAKLAIATSESKYHNGVIVELQEGGR
jgi:hypothetical protein